MSTTAEQPKWMTWTGRVLSAIPVLMLVMSAGMKLSHAKPIVEGFGKFGFPMSLLVPVGVLELLCVIIYVIPQTAVLGAVLIAAYLGGATVTHLRVGESVIAPVLLGIFAWLGIWLREPRLRALTPLRK
jgi:hypothetical protein